MFTNVYDNVTTSHTFRETFHPPVKILLTAMRISSSVLFSDGTRTHAYEDMRGYIFKSAAISFAFQKTHLPFIHRILFYIC
jgi:hypothetical protein